MYDGLSNNYDNTRKISSSSSNHDYDNQKESGKRISRNYK
jgi:hypothetical protein